MLRVLTLNVNGYRPYGDRNPILRQCVVEMRPDVLFFQEAAFVPGKIHQIAECLDGLGYRICHQFDGLAEPPGHTGVCSASRFDLEMLEVVPLPTTPRAGGYPVAALCARAHAPEPFGDVLLVNPKTNWQLHLEKEREEQVLTIAQLASKHADPRGFPPIVAADFDAAPDSSSIRFMTGRQSLGGCSTHFLDAWEMAGDGSAGHTWTTDNPFNDGIIDWGRNSRRIDYIFLGSPFMYAKRGRITRCETVLNNPVGGIYASGHFGVYAEIDVVDAGRCG